MGDVMKEHSSKHLTLTQCFVIMGYIQQARDGNLMLDQCLACVVDGGSILHRCLVLSEYYTMAGSIEIKFGLKSQINFFIQYKLWVAVRDTTCHNSQNTHHYLLQRGDRL